MTKLTRYKGNEREYFFIIFFRFSQYKTGGDAGFIGLIRKLDSSLKVKSE